MKLFGMIAVALWLAIPIFGGVWIVAASTLGTSHSIEDGILTVIGVLTGVAISSTVLYVVWKMDV